MGWESDANWDVVCLLATIMKSKGFGYEIKKLNPSYRKKQKKVALQDGKTIPNGHPDTQVTVNCIKQSERKR